MERPKKRPPVAVTTEGQPNAVVANGNASVAHRTDRDKPKSTIGRTMVAPDETGAKQAERTLPGFTAEPVWQLDKYKGRLIAGERAYQGKQFFEIRLWAGDDRRTPTHKGITLPPQAVRDLANALLAYAEARSAG